MYRDFVASKWFIGGVIALIMVAVACVFWYGYDTAPYRKAAAEAAELLQQAETKKVDTVNKADDTSVEDRTPTTEKPITETDETGANNTVSDNAKEVLVETPPMKKRMW